MQDIYLDTTTGNRVSGIDDSSRPVFVDALKIYQGSDKEFRIHPFEPNPTVGGNAFKYRDITGFQFAICIIDGTGVPTGTIDDPGYIAYQNAFGKRTFAGNTWLEVALQLNDAIAALWLTTTEYRNSILELRAKRPDGMIETWWREDITVMASGLENDDVTGTVTTLPDPTPTPSPTPTVTPTPPPTPTPTPTPTPSVTPTPTPTDEMDGYREPGTGLYMTSPFILTAGVVGAAYSFAHTATGGTPAYTWTKVSGILPPGLTLASNGTLSGTPTTAGVYSWWVRVTDSLGAYVDDPEGMTVTAS